jgi:hypothetical protein
MGVEIIHSENADGFCRAVFICTTSDSAFGPVMRSYDEADEFLQWLPLDPRRYAPGTLDSLYMDYRKDSSETAQCPTCRGTGICPPEADDAWEPGDFGLDPGEACHVCEGRKTITQAQLSINGYRGTRRYGRRRVTLAP